MLAVSALSLGLSNAAQASVILNPMDGGDLKEEYTEFEQREYLPAQAGDFGSFNRLSSGPNAGRVIASFEGISQYNVASFGRNFVPPDTMGAVGTSQYVSFLNGGFGVFDKATGATLKLTSDIAFWQATQTPGSNGDSRVMFNSAANRWVALSFGASVADIQVAVSNTADATGTWKSVKFTGFANGTADYPTMAMDSNALYIGTNNFNSAGNFRGTTMNVIPLSSILAAGGPTTTNLQQFVTPYPGVGEDRGFAAQGVNSSAASSTGTVVSASLFYTNLLTYDINNAGSGAATRSANTYLANASYDGNGPGRQPNAVPDANPNATFANNNRVIDTGDDRIGSSVWEMNGKIYAVHTVTPTGGDYTVVRWAVIDAATKTLLAEGDIGDGQHDYYQGSINVNSRGQVVIGYNRSGSGSDGKITVAARVFSTTVNGALYQRGPEEVLKVSLIDDYHNGSTNGFVAAGRQRWGDYSSVSLDPNDSTKFWVIGEFAREYNDATGGHVGTGGSRWSTWVSEIDTSTTAVPEPAQWSLMLAGFGLLGSAVRRRRPNSKVTYA
jgi:hypothetical protein